MTTRSETKARQDKARRFANIIIKEVGLMRVTSKDVARHSLEERAFWDGFDTALDGVKAIISRNKYKTILDAEEKEDR